MTNEVGNLKTEKELKGLKQLLNGSSFDVSSLGDGHCHLSVEINTISGEQLILALHKVDLPIGFFKLMSTNHIDVEVVDQLAEQLQLVAPFFGVHPWYSHLFTSLDPNGFEDEQEWKRAHYLQVLSPCPSELLMEAMPVPIRMDTHLDTVRSLMKKYSEKSKRLVGGGEIGLDKLFRIPSNGYFGNQNITNDSETKLSGCRVKLDHQVDLFKAQLQLADELELPISVHCVKAHGPLFDIVTSYKHIPRIILHSFSGSVDQARLWIRHYSKSSQRLSFSFSHYINGTESKQQHLADILSHLHDDQILIESDLSIDNHLYEDYEQHLLGIKSSIQRIKQWDDQKFYKIMAGNMYGVP